jgi:hypothetical protein
MDGRRSGKDCRQQKRHDRQRGRDSLLFFHLFKTCCKGQTFTMALRPA